MRLTNRTYAELQIGDRAQSRRLVTQDDLLVFASSSGNYNPMHLQDHAFCEEGGCGPVAPGLFVASIISGVLGTQLPGPGTLYKGQTLDFHDRAHADEELVCTVEVIDKLPDETVRLATEVRRLADDALIVSGEAEVIAPSKKVEIESVQMPGLLVERHRHFDAIIARAKTFSAITMAVVCPVDEHSLGGALLAAHEGLIQPILIGELAKIRSTAELLQMSLEGIECIDPRDTGPHTGRSAEEAASTLACQMVREGRAQAVMKGHLHTDHLLRPMLDKAIGLRIGRRFTHVFVMDIPGQPEPIFVTDAAINITPDLPTKVDICQNAIDLALALGMDPRVGVLSAVETVNPAIQSSIDAALLSKMADRGQIHGGLVEGPLAMDNAVDLGAARSKGLKGGVAGRANILVVPGLDAGNMLAKQLTFVSHAENAGLVLGARVPVVLNSRSDSPKSRLASCAVALLAHHGAQKA